MKKLSNIYLHLQNEGLLDIVEAARDTRQRYDGGSHANRLVSELDCTEEDILHQNVDIANDKRVRRA